MVGLACPAMAAITGERASVIVPGDFTEGSGVEATQLLLAGKVPFDAIFCANDMMALGCMRVLIDAGLAVPDDVGVAGFDDIPLAHYASPPLTTMKIHIAEIGERAMTRLLTRMRDPESVAESQILAPELVARASTARGQYKQPAQPRTYVATEGN